MALTAPNTSSNLAAQLLAVMQQLPQTQAVEFKLRLKYLDKPDISFTDLTSMTVMLEMSITHIVTADAHFSKVGAGFQLLP